MSPFQEARQWLREWRKRVDAKIALLMEGKTRPNFYRHKDRRGKPIKGWQK
jgi:hypothetical protein